MLLKLESKKEHEIGTLSLSGVLDISTVEAFNKSLDCFYETRKLYLDFANIDFIDSTGIGGLIQAIKQCQEREAEIKIINISAEVYEILDILGLPEIFGDEVFAAKYKS